MQFRPGFDRWFDRLVRNNMGGAALAIAGIAAGLAVITASALPTTVGGLVAWVGLALTGASAAMFVVVGIFYLRNACK
jgi:hypothetical protein